MAVSKRVRYEVLRRDNHACKYCGGVAPDVLLTVDHVVPIALGGGDDPSNLVAACRDCNAGKTSTSPDGPLVADVSSDALRWADALKQAAEEREAQFLSSRATLDQFRKLWDNWTWTDGAAKGKPLGLPGDFGSTVRQLIKVGLTFTDFEELIEVSMTTKTVRGAASKWKYFCGCCWTRVRQSQERAQQLIGGGDFSVDDEEEDDWLQNLYDTASQYWWTWTNTGLADCMCGDEYCGDRACKMHLATLIIYAPLSSDMFSYLPSGNGSKWRDVEDYWREHVMPKCVDCGGEAVQPSIRDLCAECLRLHAGRASLVANHMPMAEALVFELLGTAGWYDSDRFQPDRTKVVAWTDAAVRWKWDFPTALRAIESYYSEETLRAMPISPGCVTRFVRRERRLKEEVSNGA